MNRKILFPVPVDAHHQRESVTVLSRGKFPASLEEPSIRGEGHEILEIRNTALSASKLWQPPVLMQSPDWIPVLVAFLQRFKLHLRDGSAGDRSCSCSAVTDVMWKIGWSHGYSSLQAGID